MTRGQVQEPQRQDPRRLKVRGLACGYGETVLASDLDFEVAPGTGLLLRGPNGAGKSTLLLTLAGLLHPLAGSVSVEGHDPDDGPALHYCGHRNAVRARLGVLDTLRFWTDINGATGMEPAAALKRVGLGHIAGLDAGYLSAGQQRRLVLARLLTTNRPLWLLDEPSAALDAEGQGLLATLLTEHLGNGGMAVIATHDDLAIAGLSTLALGARP
ncbi:heme exporter protein A [Devosia lucknowensis]|uniref:Heme exporter protein A n=1 Tax=Devosia lucknowensis TaxID=1096929 RepID=A0A1Y6G9H4_9HYPH|nr:heme ABC exporter ATP-binding protein CcmA [Devosia lucknowensis]SMQ86023.1 heme exporter protein A [Devosia lucknowensis]